MVRKPARLVIVSIIVVIVAVTVGVLLSGVLETVYNPFTDAQPASPLSNLTSDQIISPPTSDQNTSVDPQPMGPSVGLSGIQVPSGFVIHEFASDLEGSSLSKPNPRMMLMKDDVLLVSVPAIGKVIALPDENGDYKADEPVVFIEGLKRPHGIDYHDGWFYIAEDYRVIRVQDANNDFKADMNTLQVIIPNLPEPEGHFTRTIKVHDNALYVSAGSSCNACNENHEWRAAITKCNLDGSNCSNFAKGLRNAVGFVFHPETGQMYATDNGRDYLGEDLPPDEINLVEQGNHYGWPVCYGKNVHDTDFDKSAGNPCTEPTYKPSLVDLQAHSAPLGLAFYNGNNFPQDYSGDLFVAYHGSWNRDEPTGYKVVRINMEDLTVTDFATGWLTGSGVTGRPVDVINGKDGSLFISDDFAGKIYRVYYRG